MEKVICNLAYICEHAEFCGGSSAHNFSENECGKCPLDTSARCITLEQAKKEAVERERMKFINQAIVTLNRLSVHDKVEAFAKSTSVAAELLYGIRDYDGNFLFEEPEKPAPVSIKFETVFVDPSDFIKKIEKSFVEGSPNPDRIKGFFTPNVGLKSYQKALEQMHTSTAKSFGVPESIMGQISQDENGDIHIPEMENISLADVLNTIKVRGLKTGNENLKRDAVNRTIALNIERKDQAKGFENCQAEIRARNKKIRELKDQLETGAEVMENLQSEKSELFDRISRQATAFDTAQKAIRDRNRVINDLKGQLKTDLFRYDVTPSQMIRLKEAGALLEKLKSFIV